MARTEGRRGVVNHHELQLQSLTTFQREHRYRSRGRSVALASDLIGAQRTRLVDTVLPYLQPWLIFGASAQQGEEREGVRFCSEAVKYSKNHEVIVSCLLECLVVLSVCKSTIQALIILYATIQLIRESKLLIKVIVDDAEGASTDQQHLLLPNEGELDDT